MVRTGRERSGDLHHAELAWHVKNGNSTREDIIAAATLAVDTTRTRGSTTFIARRLTCELRYQHVSNLGTGSVTADHERSGEVLSIHRPVSYTHLTLPTICSV